MAQFRLFIDSPKLVDFLANSQAINSECLIGWLDPNPNDNGRPMLVLNPYFISGNEFYLIDTNDTLAQTKQLAEIGMTAALFDDRKNVYPPSTNYGPMDTVYFPRHEIARLVTAAQAQSKTAIYFTHTIVNYPKQTALGVVSQDYISMSAALDPGTPPVTTSHGASTAIVTGVPCPPKWDEGLALAEECKRNGIPSHIKVVHYEDLVVTQKPWDGLHELLSTNKLK